jgi:hypothetical protein
MRGLDAATLNAEVSGAKKRLEDVCGREMRLFAYPYGQGDDFDSAAEWAVVEAGFAAACSTRFGRGSTLAERHRLRRIGINSEDSLDMVERKLDGAYDWLAVKEAIGLGVRQLGQRSAG